MYAVGEVLLIVIGILIALQIGSWNQEKRDRKLESSFLTRLRDDLAADTTYLNNRISRINDFKARQYQFIHEIYNTQNTEEEFIRVYQLQTWDSETLVMQTTTYEELVNVGLLNIISDENLRVEIIKLYREYEVAAKHINEINNFTSREIFSKSVSVGMKYNVEDLYDEKKLFTGYDWQFINDPTSEEFKLIENTQMHYFIKYDVFLRHFENLLAKSKTLLEQIDKALDES